MAETSTSTIITVPAITSISTSTAASRRAAAAAARADRRRLGIPDTKPRPLRGALWVLAAVVLAGLALLSAGDRIGQVGANATAGIEAAELLELVDHQPTSAPTTAAASPIVASASSSTDPTDGPLNMQTSPAAPFASTTVHERNESSVPDHVAVGQAALTEISYPWERLLSEWTIEFLPGQDGLYGLTLVPERRIEIYVRADQAPGMVAHVIAHELGHAVDVTLNDGSDRRRWSASRGLDDAPWWPDSGATDFSTGAGDFAESFAAWQVGPSGFRSALAAAPDGAQIELLAELSAS